MKVTKFPQSCLVLEKDGHRLAIDPGSLLAPKFGLDDLGRLDAVLYTHEHPDHYDEDLAKQLAGDGVPLFGNAAVAELIGHACQAVEDGEDFEAGGFKVKAYDLPHCKMTDGSDGPPNTGFIIEGNFFHPGDGDHAEGLTVADVALPIAGPSISPAVALEFAKSLGAKRVVPIHYDYFKADPQRFAEDAKGLGIQTIVLQPGESAEL